MLKKFLLDLTVVAFFVLSASAVFAEAQDIVMMNKDVDIAKGVTAKDVVVIGGNVTVFGRVENNIVVIGGSATLGAKSYVGGQIVVMGGEFIKDPAAELKGRITQIYMPVSVPTLTSLLKGGWMTIWTAISVLVLIGFLGLAVLIAALIPEHLGTMVNAIEHSFIAMLLWGVLWILLIAPIAVLLAISVVGIALIPLEMFLVALAMIIGYVASAVFIGKNILLSLNKVSPPFVDAVLGILILYAVGFLPIAGAILKSLFLIAGFGAVLTTRFGTIK